MKRYKNLTKEEVLEKVKGCLSLRQFSRNCNLSYFKTHKEVIRFNQHFNLNIEQIIKQNIIQHKEQELNKIVKCEFCGKEFHFKDHPSNNHNHHNFCSDQCRHNYVNSFSKGKIKIVPCKKCGKQLIVNIHTNTNVLCEECKYKYRYKYEPKLIGQCLFCHKKIKNGSRFCNNTCKNEYNYIIKIKEWKQGKFDGITGKDATSRIIKRYILEKYDHKCAICGWCQINPVTNHSPLQLHHIDGNYRNNNEDNLILLCPNCHSITPTYGSLNKGHGRRAIVKQLQNEKIDLGL